MDQNKEKKKEQTDMTHTTKKEGYSCVFIVAFPNTTYAARQQPLAGTQSCVSKNAALDRSIASFILPYSHVFHTHRFGTYSCVLQKTRLQAQFGLRFKRGCKLRPVAVFFKTWLQTIFGLRLETRLKPPALVCPQPHF